MNAHTRGNGQTGEETRPGVLFASPGAALIVNGVVDSPQGAAEEHIRTLEQLVRERTQQLVEAEATYKALAERVPVVTYVESSLQAGRLSYIGAQAESLFGLTTHELLAAPNGIEAHVHPEDRRRTRDAREECRRTGEPLRQEYRVIASDGREVWVRDEAVLLRNEEGRPPCIQGWLSDITSGKRAESQLRESESRYRLLFEHTPLPTWIFEIESLRFLAVNDAAVLHYGYTRDEFLQMTIADIRPPEDVPAVRATLASGRRGPHVVGVWRHLKKDGTLIDVEVTSNDITFDGSVARLVVARDITAEGHAQHALASHARRQAMLAELGQRCLTGEPLAAVMQEVVRVAAVALQADYSCVLELSPDARDLLLRAGLGWPEGCVGRATMAAGRGSHAGYTLVCQSPVVVDDLRTDTRFRASSLALDNGAVSGMSAIIQAPGRPFGVLAAYSRRPREFGEDEVHFLQAVANTLAAVIERERVAEDLARQRTALVRTEKLAAMGTLLAGVAHELNNPLSIVLGHAALLRRAAGDSGLAERADKINEAAERCARIVSNFLSLARQSPPEERQWINLNDVVRDALDLVAYPLRVDNVEIALDLAPDLPAVRADRHQFQQVVLNLATNAHHAMRASVGPRRLSVVTRCDSHAVAVIVADTGPGIVPEAKGRLFEPFFTTKPVGQGAGLGLSLCRGIVESHGGRIDLHGHPEIGAAFRFELPVGSPADPHAATGSGPGGAARHVLVVDDEKQIAEVLSDMLTLEGHQVDTAGEGTAALAKLRERTYDLVLSDVKMPGMDGPSLYREIQRLHPRLAPRVVFLTGDSLSADTAAFLRSSGVPNLGKPFRADDLRRVMDRILNDAMEESA